MQLNRSITNPTRDELESTPIGQWVEVFHLGISYYNICGRDCMICVIHEPTNDLRGMWHAKIEVFNMKRTTNICLNWGDRYYFELDNAVKEVEAWLTANKQLD